MAKIKHQGTEYNLPHIKLYRGRTWQPRFEPSPFLREHGWKGMAFKDDAGQWLDADATIKKAQALLKDIDAWQSGGADQAPENIMPATRGRTIGRLFEAYRKSPAYTTDIGARTRKDYNRAIEAISKMIPIDVPIESLDRPAAVALYNKMRKVHGLASANHHIRVLKRVFAIGMDLGLVTHDPLHKYRLKGTKPRVRFVEEAEIQAFVKTADDMGLFTIGSMVLVAVITGQRQGDINKFPITFTHVLTQRVTQGKRGKIVNLPEPLLNIVKARLADQHRHVRAITKNVIPTQLFIRESTGRPYPDRHAINKDFIKVRERAAISCPSMLGLEANGTPMTDKDGDDISGAMRFTFADLRDTALTRIILAECTISEACAIMGHEEKSALAVWRNYLAVRPEMSQSAGEKVAEWCRVQGISY